MMEKVFFEPWVGKDYLTGGILNKRIMVLGESLYCGGCDNCGKEMEKAEEGEGENVCWTTKKIIKRILEIDKTHQGWHNTFVKFERAVLNKELSQVEKEEFWNSVLYYNYVQESMSETRTSPSWEQFKLSETAFFEVLEKYRPQCIIVWGRRLWQNMPGGDLWNECEKIAFDWSERCGEYSLKDNTKVSVMSIYHPSVGFSWESWHPFIAEFINRA